MSDLDENGWAPDHLRVVVALMRELGVAKLHGMGLTVELGPVPEAPLPTSAAPEPEPPTLCSCGHPLDEHGPAGCLNGCDLERCGNAAHPEPEEGKA